MICTKKLKQCSRNFRQCQPKKKVSKIFKHQKYKHVHFGDIFEFEKCAQIISSQTTYTPVPQFPICFGWFRQFGLRPNFWPDIGLYFGLIFHPISTNCCPNFFPKLLFLILTLTIIQTWQKYCELGCEFNKKKSELVCERNGWWRMGPHTPKLNDCGWGGGQ